MLFTLASRAPAGWLGANVLVDQVYFASMIVASLIILSSRPVKWRNLFTANAAIMLFYGYFAVSFLWSSTPVDSLIRILKDFGTTVVMILIIFSEKNPLEAVRAVYVRCACVALPLSMLVTRYYSIGRGYSQKGFVMYNGIAGQKNSFGSMLMVFILFLVWDHFESRPASAKWPWSRMRWDRLALLLMGAWLLDLSESKTSLVCLLIGLALICTREWLASRMIGTMIFFVALSLPFLLLLTQELGWITAPVLEAIGRDATFTGRASIWEHITLATVNPLMGAGFWNFWGTINGRAIALALGPDNSNPNVFVPSAHDGYVDVYLDGGFIGLALLSLFLIVAATRIIKVLPLNGFHRLRFTFLILAIVANLTESFFARPGPMWFTTVLVLIDYPFRATDLRNRKVGWPGRGLLDVGSRDAAL
jgi:O-antigen ligase